MNQDLRYEFFIGDWLVEPALGRLSQGEKQVSIRPKVMDLLVYLSQKKDTVVSQDELMEAVWGGTIVSDSSIYYSINLLREALGDDKSQPEYIETISKRGYRLIAPVKEIPDEETGLPDLTDQPQRQTTDNSLLGLLRHKLIGIILVVTVMIIGTLVYYNRLSTSPFALEKPSIAVLAFKDFSSDGDQKYFADGISDEIINMLAQIPELQVTSRSSAFQFRDNDIHIPTVAQKLGVAHVLEGSVRKSDTTIRIAAQLIDARTDKHIWSATYDSELKDIFVMQDEISTAIVEALKETLGVEITAPEIKKAKINAEAYNEFLLGVYNFELRLGSTMQAATGHFERAIELQPNYAAAHARLAMNQILLPNFTSEYSRADSLEPGHFQAQRAMTLAPVSWEANLAMGLYHWNASHFDEDKINKREAVRYFERAIALNPSYSSAYTWLSVNLMALGAYEEAFENSKIGLNIDPLAPVNLHYLAMQYAVRGRFEEARSLLERVMLISPNLAYKALPTVDYLEGRWADTGIDELRKLAFQSSPTINDIYTAQYTIGILLGLIEDALTVGDEPLDLQVLILHGQPDAALQGARDIIANSTTLGMKIYAGEIMADIGEMDDALKILDKRWQGPEPPQPIAPSPQLVAARLALGDAEGARSLVEIGSRTVSRKKSAYSKSDLIAFHTDIEEGLRLYLIGEKEEGLRVLASAVGGGGFVPTWPVYLADLMVDPDFQPILRAQEAKQAFERNKFLTIMCGPDNPVADYWKPLPESCEGYVNK